jgi:hypothetical protein
MVFNIKQFDNFQPIRYTASWTAGGGWTMRGQASKPVYFSNMAPRSSSRAMTRRWT